MRPGLLPTAVPPVPPTSNCWLEGKDSGLQLGQCFARTGALGAQTGCCLCHGCPVPPPYVGSTHWPREVCTSSVMSVEVAGQTQLRASMAYLHSSSQTT